MLVFVIAAVPALVVAIVASTTGSRFATALTAAIAIALGVFTGNPIYALLDVGAVAVALYLSWPERSPEKKAELEAKSAYWNSPEGKAKDRENGYWAYAVVVIALLVYMYFVLFPTRQPRQPSGETTIHSPVKKPSIESVEVPSTHQLPGLSLSTGPSKGEVSKKAEISVANTKSSSAVRASETPYILALQRIESAHPELNPDSVRFRQEYVNFVFKRMAEYVSSGHLKHEALELSVHDLITHFGVDSSDQKPVVAKRPIEELPILDRGGHAGFDPACRWVTPQEWSCKKPVSAPAKVD